MVSTSSPDKSSALHAAPAKFSDHTTKIVYLTENAIREVKRRLAELASRTPPKNEEKSTSSPAAPPPEPSTTTGLRLGVKGGGCSGLSYVIDMDQCKTKDHIDTRYGFPIFIDPKSSLYLKGIELDYEGGFMGSGFKFKNPNTTNTCGCGESFSL